MEEIIGWTRGLEAGEQVRRSPFICSSSAAASSRASACGPANRRPCPRRPYGKAKLAQERLVEELRRDMAANIYRPSSVYGFSGIRGRLGLLNTLLDNANKHVPSRVFGGLDTVRDYVLSSDIGEFIVRRMRKPVSNSRTFLLASGKPTSVSEMLHIASKVVGRPLYLKLDVKPSNAGHITYRSCALPEDWRPTDLETGVRQVARQVYCRSRLALDRSEGVGCGGVGIMDPQQARTTRTFDSYKENYSAVVDASVSFTGLSADFLTG